MVSSVRLRAVLGALLVTFLWSTSWVLIKFAIEDIPPLTFAGLRYTLAVLILLPGLRKHGATLRAITPCDWWRLAALGLVFYTLTQGGQFMTLKYVEATTFSLILNFTTVLIAIFGIVVLNEVPAPLQWVGILIFVGGAVLYFAPGLALAGKPIGFIFAVLTLCANAGAALLGRSVNRQQTLPPLVVTVLSMGIGAVILLGMGLLVEPFPALNVVHVGVILWLALINTAFAFTLWNRTLQTLSAVESGVINNTMLIQIAILAWFFLGEQLSSLEILGLALAAAGSALVNLKPAQTDQD